MSTPITRREIKAATRGGLVFVVPAGTPVEPFLANHYGPQDDRSKPLYWISPSALPQNSIERHDATYYGIRVTEEHVAHIETVCRQKPIPWRRYDWEARYADVERSPVGYGRTEDEAIEELLDLSE